MTSPTNPTSLTETSFRGLLPASRDAALLVRVDWFHQVVGPGDDLLTKEA